MCRDHLLLAVVGNADALVAERVPANLGLLPLFQQDLEILFRAVARKAKTDQHDVETKINQARKFLEHKDKVLVYVLYKGRELQHIEEGKRILELILEKLGDTCKVEQAPRMEGKV